MQSRQPLKGKNMKPSELRQLIREEIRKIISESSKNKNRIHTFESFLNEAKIPDMSNVPLGAVTSYGEEVGTYQLGETGRGISTVSTLRLYQAQQIADALNKGGFEAEAIQLKGQYYDGYVEVKTPRTYNDIKKMAGIIEDNLGHWLVNSKDERIRDKGRI